MSTEGRTQFTLMVHVASPIDDCEGAGIYETIFYGLGVYVDPESYLQTGGAGGTIMVQFTVFNSDVDCVITNLRGWSDTTFEAHAA